MPQTTRVRGFKVTVSKAMLTANWITSCWAGKVYSGLQYLGKGNKIYHFVTKDIWNCHKGPQNSTYSGSEKDITLLYNTTLLETLRCPEIVATKITLSMYHWFLYMYSLSGTEFYIFFFINTKCSCKLDISVTSWLYPYIYFLSYTQTIM